MKLYHFTIPENLFRIHQRGLEPGFDPDGIDWQTCGQPVVWLTTQESNRATQADVDHYKPLDNEFNVGDTMFGGPVRLAVDVERHNKRLVKYTTFLENDLHGREVLKLSRATMPPGCVDRWWIYLGTIAPRKIEFAPGLPPGILTIRLLLPSADLYAEKHVDPIVRRRYAEMARRMRAADNPDALVDICPPVEEDPLQPADVVAPGQGTAVAGRARSHALDAYQVANVRPIAAPTRRQNGFSAKGS
jgi:hypothetical protein